MSGSNRQAYAELANALSVTPGVETVCCVCGVAYVPEAALHVLCAPCFGRLRRVATFRETLLLVGLRALAAQGASPARDASP